MPKPTAIGSEVVARIAATRSGSDVGDLRALAGHAFARDVVDEAARVGRELRDALRGGVVGAIRRMRFSPVVLARVRHSARLRPAADRG